MYNDYFGLRENPFTISPDPRYLYMAKGHEEAYAHLLYGVQNGNGFVQLTGEVGTGKTTLLRALLKNIPQQVETAFILNPRLDATEFVAAILDDLKVAYPKQGRNSIKTLVDCLNAHLIDVNHRGGRVILIIDEAQNLNRDVLEQLRLLTNLETDDKKLLQFILVGQPELRNLLARHDLRQLAQRITAKYHLQPMTRLDTLNYISCRLQRAGMQGNCFTKEAIAEVHRATQGVPRLINVLCDRAMLGAYSRGSRVVTQRIVLEAAKEVAPPAAGMNRFRAVVLRGIRNVARLDGRAVRDGLKQRKVAAAAGLVLGSIGAAWALGLPPFRHAHDHPHIEAGVITTAAPEPSTAQPVVWPAAASPPPADDSAAGSEATLAELLASAHDNRDTSYHTLFSVWGVTYMAQAGTGPCEQARVFGLHCLWQIGSWTKFMTYNRPGVVTLKTAEGRRKLIPVLRLTGQSAQIAIGDARYVVPIETLRSLWDEQFMILWRPPFSDQSVIRPGDEDVRIAWIREKLSAIGYGGQRISKRFVFDPSLVKQVKAFQSKQGLNADGIIGPQTLIHLNSVAAVPGVPLLMRAVVTAGRE